MNTGEWMEREPIGSPSSSGVVPRVLATHLLARQHNPVTNTPIPKTNNAAMATPPIRWQSELREQPPSLRALPYQVDRHSSHLPSQFHCQLSGPSEIGSNVPNRGCRKVIRAGHAPGRYSWINPKTVSCSVPSIEMNVESTAGST